MFLFTEPYISGLAKNFISQSLRRRVVANRFINDQLPQCAAEFIPQTDAIEKVRDTDGRWIYSNSENALEWVRGIFPSEHRLRKNIEIFKNKRLFREIYSGVFGGLKYLCLTLKELQDYCYDDFGSPFILKPTVGFLSAGVSRIGSRHDFSNALSKLHADMESMGRAFPKSVLDGSTFLLEEIIEGREFAIDAFFTDDNKPVIVNIFEHRFRDPMDMSDRLYITSANIVRQHMQAFTEFLDKLQTKCDLAGFAVHVELRITPAGEIKPIEVNPLRFAGWCTTDLAYWAYGVNPYECFAQRQGPDWREILSRGDNCVYCMSVLSCEKIEAVQRFDYERLAARFSDLKELRKIDYKKYRIFGFAFYSVNNNDSKTLSWILNNDLSEFCTYFTSK